MEPPPSYKDSTTFGNVFLWEKVAAIECYLRRENERHHL
jgi:hypothetical protein